MGRMDAPDTIDIAIGFLQRLQAEGWGTASVECHIDYAAFKAWRDLPVGATVTVRLTPAKGGSR